MYSQFGSSGGADQKSTLWMGDLEGWMDEGYIRQLWYSLGETVNVKMIRDKITGSNAGYCFIDFASHASALRQLNSVNGSVIPGTNKVFRLNWASGGGLVDKGERTSGPEYSVFVGDLSAEVNDMLLLATFQSRFTSIKSAKVVTDPATGMSRGYGFVRFGEEIEQQRAMTEMNGQYCGSRPMRIASATPKNKTAGSSGTTAGLPGQMGVGMGGMGGGFNMAMQVPMGMPHQMAAAGYYGMPMQGLPPQQLQHSQQHSQQHAHQQQVPIGGNPYGLQQQQQYNGFTDPNNTTIFIGGLNPSITDDDLRTHFAQFGEIIHTRIPPGRGCGFVTFNHRQSAETAIQQMNNAVIGNSRVRLSWGKAQQALKTNFANGGGYMSGPGIGGGPNSAGAVSGGPAAGNPGGDPMLGEPVDRINESFIAQKEDGLGLDVGETGWRQQPSRVFAQ